MHMVQSSTSYTLHSQAYYIFALNSTNAQFYYIKLMCTTITLWAAHTVPTDKICCIIGGHVCNNYSTRVSG
jgi:hypothetical protein